MLRTVMRFWPGARTPTKTDGPMPMLSTRDVKPSSQRSARRRSSGRSVHAGRSPAAARARAWRAATRAAALMHGFGRRRRSCCRSTQASLPDGDQAGSVPVPFTTPPTTICPSCTTASCPWGRTQGPRRTPARGAAAVPADRDHFVIAIEREPLAVGRPGRCAPAASWRSSSPSARIVQTAPSRVNARRRRSATTPAGRRRRSSLSACVPSASATQRLPRVTNAMRCPSGLQAGA